MQLPFSQVEESIPLNTSIRRDGEEEEDMGRQRKGKQRSRDDEAVVEPIFDVGDSDDEEFKHSSNHK